MTWIQWVLTIIVCFCIGVVGGIIKLRGEGYE